MIEAFPSDGSYEALDVGRLPGTAKGDQELLNAHVVDSVLEDFAIDSVPVSEQVFRRGVPGKGLEDLQGSPLGSWVGRHVEVQDAPAVMAEDRSMLEVRGLGGEMAEIRYLKPHNSTLNPSCE